MKNSDLMSFDLLFKADRNYYLEFEQNDFIFFYNNIVQSGSVVSVYGRFKCENEVAFEISDINYNPIGVMIAKGTINDKKLQEIDKSFDVSNGARIRLGTIKIPDKMRPGVYFINKKFIFFVRDKLNPFSIVVLLPLCTYHIFSRWGGESYYTRTNKRNDFSCSMLRPIDIKSFANIRISIKALSFFQQLFGNNIYYIGDHELPNIKSNKPALIINIGRSEYWTNESVMTVESLKGVSQKFLFVSSETMWRIVTIDNNKILLSINHMQRPPIIIREIIGVNPIDGGFVTKDMYSSKFRYGNYTVISPQSFIFKETGLHKGDSIRLPTAPYDGLPINGFDGEGFPIIDKDVLLNKWKYIECFAYSMGNIKLNYQKHIGAMSILKTLTSESEIIHFGSLSWVDSSLIYDDHDHPVKLIFMNAFEYLLRDSYKRKNNIFKLQNSFVIRGYVKQFLAMLTRK